MENNFLRFECHMYVGLTDELRYNLPKEAGPRKVIKFVPLSYDQLTAPDFRRLLAAFDTVPQPVALT
jgi:hypothetical protein